MSSSLCAAMTSFMDWGHFSRIDQSFLQPGSSFHSFGFQSYCFTQHYWQSATVDAWGCTTHSLKQWKSSHSFSLPHHIFSLEDGCAQCLKVPCGLSELQYFCSNFCKCVLTHTQDKPNRDACIWIGLIHSPAIVLQQTQTCISKGREEEDWM